MKFIVTYEDGSSYDELSVSYIEAEDAIEAAQKIWCNPEDIVSIVRVSREAE